ncbi:winged helix-turn-helix domain-containing protein [Vibrio sp. SS-MA-C1-2]|uniref:winged helix-turn-helix domain-containing protein n=1 Tax=Vibrio sp. SS-MA-C1-2 TaxID=2908646 RepID=UPI001F200B08|nr:winged helix-turn-helix domain-containing protein [Vibrio sp. SS-MA-C1-2]UJF18772.1 winged helix-turn-helix domain-containing protein [Vibrio sp. SS-MA-C1-2]
MTQPIDKKLINKKFIFDSENSELINIAIPDDIVRLGSNENRALQFLIDNRQSTVSRQQLHAYIWRDHGFEVDDSSLTQAISTLRKLLQDSTKSPEYIKTIPKRGYQFIANIENNSDNSLELTSTDFDISETNEEFNTASLDISTENINHSENTTEALHRSAPVSLNDRVINQADLNTSATGSSLNDQNTNTSQGLSIFKIITIVIALLLPILAYTLTDIEKVELLQVTDIEGIPIYTVQEHKGIEQWMPLLKQCTTNYLDTNKTEQAPQKIILSPGLNHNLIVNFIHAPNIKIEDNLITLIEGESNPEIICR